jgi:hypothetical protein
METKASWITSWETIHSSPWEQQRRWVFVGWIKVALKQIAPYSTSHSTRFLVKCESGISHVTPKWNVSSNLLILYNSNKNRKLIRCNHCKVECAKCHNFFGQISLVDLLPPIYS